MLKNIIRKFPTGMHLIIQPRKSKATTERITRRN